MMQSLRTLTILTALLLSFVLHPSANAEQKRTFGQYEVHYIVVPTTFLRANIANQYGLVRGRDRALLNISVLGVDGKASTARLEGHARNLLEQRQALDFREVREGEAVYYLALIRHADEEHQRFQVDIELPDGSQNVLEWHQKLYWDD